MRIYIRRREEEKIRKIKGWTLIYGRRKTGKTTLVKNNLKIDFYTLIADSNNAIIPEDRIMKIDEVLKEVKSIISKGGTAVIDEFQRLPEVYWSVISSWPREGILVLVASSYGIVNKLFDRNSPLLGLFLPLDIGIISYEDVLTQLKDPILSTLYRDPWIIPFIDNYQEFVTKVKEISLISKGLIGEVFKEEERQLTDIYYRTLLLLGEGIWKTSEIAGIIQPKGGESTISSMVNKLVKIGLVQKIPTLSRENYYKVYSPPLSLALYAEAKYAVSELDIKVSELPIGREVQFSVGELLAKYFNGVLYYSPKEDIDVVIMKKKKPVWAFEVKMGEISREEAKEAIKRMSRVAEKVGLISLKEKPEDYGDLSIGPKELLEIAEEVHKRGESDSL
ncbi:ATP-binding protein [Sulfolobus sp. S-194]|uniref:ATP-binding protein n=1 Tax=Sulfolobus sp. S-194 TaxID=2512240 RepID=UPI001436F58A|nr:ATP-binding protein [Sulfolobus sp. S-194]QIW22790.1 ATP-binding protein [Sulfolobus sp. S-194]